MTSSSTTTTSETSVRTISNGIVPAIGAARPSAIVLIRSSRTGLPASSARRIPAAPKGSIPTTRAPARSAAKAIAWAAFPALMVTIPRSRCSLERLATAKAAPRGLNDPVRWRFSAFRYAFAPIRSPRERLVSSGVRCTTDVTMGRARSTSASVTLTLLMGMIHPTRGGATVFGLDSDRDAVAVKRQVGYVPGETPQFGGWRGSMIVAYVAGLRGGVSDAVVASLAKRLDLDLGRRYREYSHGNKQKLLLVLAFMHRPTLLILDEPTGGLDPLHQQVFYELIREARAGGTTVFLSSHVLSEVEHVCDRVGIVREGSLVTVGTLAELVGVRARRVEVEFAGTPPLARLAAVPGLEQLDVRGQRVRGLLRGDIAPLLSAIASERILDLESREPSLEEIFLSYYAGPAKRE